MKAVILAAGVGARLMPRTDSAHKCLTEIGGRSLLHRHLDILDAAPEVDGVIIVVGYLREQIYQSVTQWHDASGAGLSVQFITNEVYRKGSILSLYAAKEVLCAHDSIVMDADVLYHPDVMGRLLRSQHRNCFLVDPSTMPRLLVRADPCRWFPWVMT